jgi:uncharacterized iron-regulated membrane protein
VARIDSDKARTLLALHGWPAALLGLALYAVVLTGAVSVLEREIAAWSSPLAGAASAERALPPGLDGALRHLSTEVNPAFHEEISAHRAAGGRLRVFFHRHDVHPRTGDAEDRGVEFDLDPVDLRVIDRREGWAEEIRALRVPDALANFVSELHVRLRVPEPYGLVLTGVLGLSMLTAAVTGLFAHRQVLRDLFTLRGSRASLLAKRDLHARAGVWLLPFAALLAFTGSFFSFADGFGYPLMARVAFAGDEDRLFEQLVGVPPVEDARPAPVADLDRVIEDAGHRAGTSPRFLVIERWGRQDSRVTLFTELADGELINANLVYAGPSGAWLHTKPAFGLVPSAGGTLAHLVSPLHFGNFAGWFSRLLWLGLGLTVAYVSLTGLLLWCERRREIRAWRWLGCAASGVGFGLPLALAVTPYAYFIARAAGVAQLGGHLTGTFLITAAVAVLGAFLTDDQRSARRLMLMGTGVALLGLPALRLLSGGAGGAASFAEFPDALAMDALFALGGLSCMLAARRAPAVSSSPLPA